jgi:hypothetical protein
MHADVGGGYPDESLSYISLLWMLEEAKKADLRTLDVITERHLALASSFGPLHDSRAGPGAYYRYQPRRIGAWLDPPEPDTAILRDPSLRHKNRKPRGLLRSVQIHESVISRIAEGTDSYAPITIPARFEIAPAQDDGENKPQRDSESREGEQRTSWRRMIDPQIRARLQTEEVRTARAEAATHIWDAVLLRRLIYFATLAVTAWLVLLPFVARPETPVEKTVCADDRCVLPWLISQTKILLPEFAEKWIDKYAADPGIFAVLLAALLFLLWIGSRNEAAIAARSRGIWRATLQDGEWPEPPGLLPALVLTPLRFIRTSTLYQFLIRLLKWDLLPRLIGWVIVAALLYSVAALATQAWLAAREPAERFCKEPPRRAAPLGSFRVDSFDTSQTCTYAGGSVEKDHIYRVTMSNVVHGRGVAGWSDGGYLSTPIGHKAAEMGWRGYLGSGLRRVVGARYMQPLVEIRPVRRGVVWPAVYIQKLSMREENGTYWADFKARGDGSLHLFVNDSALPLGWTERLYGNNHGSADVRITRLSTAPARGTGKRQARAERAPLPSVSSGG